MKQSRFSLILAAAIIMSMAGCGQQCAPEQTAAPAGESVSVTETVTVTEEVTEAESTAPPETTAVSESSFERQTAPAEELSAEQIGAAYEAAVDISAEYQTIRGFGGINHPDWIPDLTKSQRRTAFGNEDGQLGFTVLRVYISENKKMWAKSVATAKAAQEQGAVIFASPWHPPAELCEEFTRNGKEGQKRLRHDKYAEYAEHLNDFVHYMKDNGVDIYAVSVQNEPDYAEEWTWWTSDETTDFLENYADKIDCRVMSPESFQYTNKDYYTKILDSEKAFDNCDLFGTHLYGTQRGQMDFPALEECCKEIWMTEVYTPNSEKDSNMRWPESLKTAENIHNALVVGNMNAYVWWYIRRNYGPMNEDGSISKRGCCMAQYSKYVRPGAVRVEVTEQPADKVYLSAYRDGDRVMIAAINMGKEDITLHTEITGADISTLSRCRTSENEDLAVTDNMTADGSGFYALLPAESVSTFVAVTG